MDGEDSSKEILKVKSHRRGWLTRRNIISAALILIAIVALAVGLGVGLSQRGGENGEGESSPPAPPTNTSTNSTGPWWKPRAGATWQYQILYALNDTSPQVDVWDIDLFNNDRDIIQRLQNDDQRVICYFSAGSYEDWRPDKGQFKDADLGKALDGWPGEKWLNVRSQNVRTIMLSRLDLAAQKRCDGVDPDNVDGYDNDNGLDLTQDDAVDYMNFLSQAAHVRNLSLGLKNAGAIVPRILDQMQWSVQEQCIQDDECDQFRPFIEQAKPVFHVEYPKGSSTNTDVGVSSSSKDRICDNTDAAGFSTIIKNMDLDNWIESC